MRRKNARLQALSLRDRVVAVAEPYEARRHQRDGREAGRGSKIVSLFLEGGRHFVSQLNNY